MTAPVMACLVLASALLFGGGARRDVPSDFVPEFLAIALLVIAGPAGLRRLREAPLAGAVLAAVVGLAIVHLIPLPPSIWGLLPGREVALASYEAAQMTPPWLPISLQPAAAQKGAFALLPGVALFLATLALPARERAWLVILTLVVGALSVCLGLLQIMAGAGSPFYFFAITNPNNAVGFFANRNHFAAFLYVLIPLAAALLSEKRDVQGLPFWAILAFAWFVCLMGLATTGSRSALLLGAVSILLSFVLIVRPGLPEYFRGRRARLGLIAMAALVIALAGAMGGVQILGRFEGDLLDDARPALSAATLDLAWRYFPIGSGLGSFEKIYEMQAPTSAIFNALANHAHNDWMEIFLEAGPLGLAVAAAFLVFLARMTVWAVKAEPGFEGRLAVASAVLIWLLCIHSLWDYPLRTIALSSLFGVACACLIKAPEGGGPTVSRRRRRGRRTKRMSETSPGPQTEPV